jgi:hypothetical protein
MASAFAQPSPAMRRAERGGLAFDLGEDFAQDAINMIIKDGLWLVWS